MSLSEEQKIRYSRAIMLDAVGEDGQTKIAAGRVALIGCGALGSTAALYLAASGVGKLTLCDFDNVDLSNLQRQIAFSEASIGKNKAQALAETLGGLNSTIELSVVQKLIRRTDLDEIVAQHDVVLECSDNPSTKLLVTDTCAQRGVACVAGGVSNFDGQVLTITSGSITYRDLFGDAPACNGFTPCSTGGVFGPTPGIVATIQAAEALKILASVGSPLANRLLTVNALTMTFREIKI